jgi:hypothetical protein
MTRSTHVFVFALAAMLLAGNTIHADVIHWDYSWSMSPASGAILADPPGQGMVVFSLEKPGSGADTSDINAANLRTVTQASAAGPDRFATGALYTLTLTITDERSGLVGSVTFSGKLSGTFSTMNTDVHNAFIGPRRKALDLGGYHYVVTIGPYSPPGPPDSNNAGGIGARVVVSGGGIQIDDAPEPSAFALSGLGGIGLFAFTLFRRVRHLTATSVGRLSI